MIETLAGISFIGLIISLIAFIIQLLRRKANKKQWGIAIVFLLIAFLIAGALRPYYRSSDSSKRVEKVEKKTVEEPKQTKKEKKAKPAVKKQKKKLSETERFAKDNNISVALAEDLKRVLGEMELTDKSRVGAFHYELSDVYEWERVEDWAEGRRYSGWMDMEHIFYYYVKDDKIVSVRTSDGDFLYQAE